MIFRDSPRNVKTDTGKNTECKYFLMIYVLIKGLQWNLIIGFSFIDDLTICNQNTSVKKNQHSLLVFHCILMINAVILLCPAFSIIL
jgi:hypothetical protein